MRKYFTLILLSIFLCTNTLTALADGIGNDQTSNYPGVIDYRHHQIFADPTHSKRPTAGFALQINSNGVLGNEILSGSWDSNKHLFSSAQNAEVFFMFL
ncbi:MAG: hypothetical protein GX333_04120 [Syntrophomonadaceae bacterium]|nr:hypothetical protein [Syntrophomonadaceae bacterium]